MRRKTWTSNSSSFRRNNLWAERRGLVLKTGLVVVGLVATILLGLGAGQMAAVATYFSDTDSVAQSTAQTAELAE